jgi:hypothetical protein
MYAERIERMRTEGLLTDEQSMAFSDINYTRVSVRVRGLAHRRQRGSACSGLKHDPVSYRAAEGSRLP